MSELLGGAIGETSSGQHVLMKDQSRIKKAVRQTTIVVNSRDRNYLNYPNSNHFRYTMRRPLTNVINIELVNAVIPSFLFVIDKPWATFTFQESTTQYEVTLTFGYYTESQLITELQLQLNSIPGKINTYSISQNPRDKAIIITATNPSPVSFTLLFFSGIKRDEIDMNNVSILAINTPARLLGFGVNDYVSVGGAITAPLPMDLENFFNRLYLHFKRVLHNMKSH